MRILILSLVAVSLVPAKCFSVEMAKFSEEDLKKFSMNARPQKDRNIREIDQKTDVIYFEENTDLIKSLGMDDYIKYSEPSNALRTVRALSTEDVIKVIEYLEKNNKAIKVINLIDNAMINDSILEYLKYNVESLAFLNIQNTMVTKKSIRDFKEKRPGVKVIS